MLPTVTLPKLTALGFDPKSPSASPVPDNGTVSVELEALEVTVTLPLTLAADCGANVAVNVVLWPAASVIGVGIPMRLNPVPLIPT